MHHNNYGNYDSYYEYKSRESHDVIIYILFYYKLEINQLTVDDNLLFY